MKGTGRGKCHELPLKLVARQLKDGQGLHRLGGGQGITAGEVVPGTSGQSTEESRKRQSAGAAGAGLGIASNARNLILSDGELVKVTKLGRARTEPPSAAGSPLALPGHALCSHSPLSGESRVWASPWPAREPRQEPSAAQKGAVCGPARSPGRGMQPN